MSGGLSVWEFMGVIAGMALITLVARGFFFISQRELPLPGWLREGLRYAPLAALAAVITPELVMWQGQLIGTWKDARLYGAAAGVAWFCWRGSMLGTIISGTAVFLVFRLGWGW